MFQFPRRSWLYNGLHRTQASSIPHQTLLPMDPFSPGFLLVSRSDFPLLTTLAALSSSSHTGRVGISSPPGAKAWGNLSQDFLPTLGRPRRSVHIASMAAPRLRELSLPLLPLLLLSIVQVPAWASLRPCSLQRASKDSLNHSHIHSFTHIHIHSFTPPSSANGNICASSSSLCLHHEVLVYGTLSRGNALNSDYVPGFLSNENTQKTQHSNFHLNVRKNLSAVRMIGHLNRLPREVSESLCLEILQNHLNSILSYTL